MVAESLQTLRADPGCKSAGYHPSKNQFSVVRNSDNRRKAFRVMQLKRKLGVAAGSDSMDVEEEFAKAVQLARTWMACEEAPAEDSDDEAKMAGDESPDPLDDAPAASNDEEDEMEDGEALVPLDDAPAKASEGDNMEPLDLVADAPAEGNDS